MSVVGSARARARAELSEQIKEAAREQLATAGASGLSLRAVARGLDIAPSAIYRYFPNRDALLTALLVDAFNALGSAVESAVQRASIVRDPRAGWRAVCTAVRAWAGEHPHEYALIHGSPVPGYEAPRDTVAPAARTPLAIMGVLRDARDAGWLVEPSEPSAPDGKLAEQFASVAEREGIEIPVGVLARGTVAWSQLFGMVSFELFGSFVGTVDPADEFFEYAVERMAEFLGLAA